MKNPSTSRSTKRAHKAVQRKAKNAKRKHHHSMPTGSLHARFGFGHWGEMPIPPANCVGRHTCRTKHINRQHLSDKAKYKRKKAA